MLYGTYFFENIFFIFIDASFESESSCGVCFVLMFYGLKLKNNHISFTIGQPVAWQLMFAPIVIDLYINLPLGNECWYLPLKPAGQIHSVIMLMVFLKVCSISIVCVCN